MKTIKIKKEHKKHIKTMTELETDARILMDRGAELFRKSHRELWIFLSKEYSLDLTKKLSFDLNKMEIIDNEI